MLTDGEYLKSSPSTKDKFIKNLLGQLMLNVIIVGAGPAGLMLSIELASRGIKCLIIEKREHRLEQSRAFSLSPRTLELLDMRGIAESIINNGLICNLVPLGDAEHSINLQRLDSNFPYFLNIPQIRFEEILEKLAVDHGVEIVRSATLLNFEQNEARVDVTYGKNGQSHTASARYVLGCDGAYSKVRSLANIPTKSTVFENSVMHGDVYLTHPPTPKIFARTNHRGMALVIPFRDDTYRIYIVDNKKLHVPEAIPIALSDFQESVLAIAERDFGFHSPLWLSRFRGQQKHAESYKKTALYWPVMRPTAFTSRRPRITAQYPGCFQFRLEVSGG